MSDLPPTQDRVTPRQAGLRKGAKPSEFDAATIRLRLVYIAQLIAPLGEVDISGATKGASPSIIGFGAGVREIMRDAIEVVELSQRDRARTLEVNRAANRREGR